MRTSRNREGGWSTIKFHLSVQFDASAMGKQLLVPLDCLGQY